MRGSVCEVAGGTEEVASGSSSVDKGGLNYVGQKVEEILKGKVLEASVVPVFVYGLGTIVLTKRQGEKLHLGENNWIMIISNREDRREMGELKEEKKVVQKERKTEIKMEWQC